jgi:hypothetical protein
MDGSEGSIQVFAGASMSSPVQNEKEEAIVLFLKKKNQKDFYFWGSVDELSIFRRIGA